MEKYIQSLIKEIEEITIKRWRECPPHFWCVESYGSDAFTPKALSPQEVQQLKEKGWERDFGSTYREKFAEIETYTSGEKDYLKQSMYGIFGIERISFPPVEKLNANQVERLTQCILQLWFAYNYTAAYPECVPPKVLYPLLLKKMHEREFLFIHGATGIEFCHYDPNECPFGLDYCDCKEIIDLESKE